ncbi:hypothetical protein [Desulfurobacterium sp.]
MDFYDVIFTEHIYNDKETAQKQVEKLSARYKKLSFSVVVNALGYTIRATGRTTPETIKEIKGHLGGKNE